MGIRDFFDNIGLTDAMENIKDKVTEVTDEIRYKAYDVQIAVNGVSEATKEFKEDMGELFTYGAHEIFINDNLNYKTSREVRGEAESIVQKSLALHQDAVNNIQREHVTASQKLLDFRIKSKTIINGAVSDWLSWAQNQNMFDLDSVASELRREFKLIEIKSVAVLKYNEIFVKNSLNAIGSPKFEHPEMKYFSNLMIGLPVLSAILIHRRIEASDEFLQNAKDYATQIAVTIEKLNSYVPTFREMCHKVDEISFMLDIFSEMLASQLMFVKASENIYDEIISSVKTSFLLVSAINTLVKIDIVRKDGQVDAWNGALKTELDKIVSIFN